MKNNPQSPTPDVEKTTPTVDAEFPSLQGDDTTSGVAIAYWCLAALGIIIAMFIKNPLLIASLIGSSLTLLWMGHVVNYLKQIANKK